MKKSRYGYDFTTGNLWRCFRDVGFCLVNIFGDSRIQKRKTCLEGYFGICSVLEHLQIRIVNTNFRPITITSIGGQLMVRDRYRFRWIIKEGVPANAFMDLPKPDLPITLEDGESLVVKLQQVMSPYFWDKDNKLEVFVHDAEGNTYKQTNTKTYDAKYGRYYN
jgi:hypothetical protein